MIQLENHWTDWDGGCAIGDYPQIALLNFLRAVITKRQMFTMVIMVIQVVMVTVVTQVTMVTVVTLMTMVVVVMVTMASIVILATIVKLSLNVCHGYHSNRGSY
jgi:hypothetical protein